MKRVAWIGDIFFKARGPETLQARYREHLRIAPGADGGGAFEGR